MTPTPTEIFLGAALVTMFAVCLAQEVRWHRACKRGRELTQAVDESVERVRRRRAHREAMDRLRERLRAERAGLDSLDERIRTTRAESRRRNDRGADDPTNRSATILDFGSHSGSDSCGGGSSSGGFGGGGGCD